MSSPRDAIGLARDAESNGTYHDVHCWVFTPTSFAELFRSASALGLVQFTCEDLIATERYQFDFYVAMRPCDDAAKAEASWAEAAARLSSAAPPQ